MPEIIEQYYAPLLKGHGFIPDPDNQQYIKTVWGKGYRID